MKKLILVLLLGACHWRSVPDTRNPLTEGRAAMTITAACGERVALAGLAKYDGTPRTMDVEWVPTHTASAVIISHRRALTSAHAVGCPTLPRIAVRLSDGTIDRMVVDRDDIMFGRGRDIARLDLLHAGWLSVPVAVPVIAAPSPGSWCAETMHGRTCGDSISIGDELASFTADTRDGDSGAGVYDGYGRLIGVVVGRRGPRHTVIQRIPADWVD